MLHLAKHLVLNGPAIEASNLADRFDSDDLKRIGNYCFEGYQRDEVSRMVWKRRMEAALDLALQLQKPKTYPWPGASNIVFPLVTVAGLQFVARAYPSLIQGTDVVRYRVIGDDSDGTQRSRALRIGRHMSWQVLEEDESWEEQHDRLFLSAALVGSAFIKSYYNASLKHIVGELVMASDLTIDYWAKSVETAQRKTQRVQLSRNTIYERAMQETFVDVRDRAWFRGTPPLQLEVQERNRRLGVEPAQPDESTPFQGLEQHRTLDLDGDGYGEPYIITLEESSREVLRIVSRVENESDVVRNLRKEIVSIRATEYFTKYSFLPSPDGGIYDLGFGLLLGPINEGVDTGLNQLFDNGTMQNSIGGFLGRGAKIRGGIATMAPWEFKRVDSTGDDLRKNIVPFPERKPSEIILPIIQLLIQYANRVAGTTETVAGENPGQNTPAQTYQAMTEQGLQVYSMVFKRMWRCMKDEFRKRFELNARYVATHQHFGPGQDFVRREDYQGNPDQIAPVADPNITSTVMRIAQAAALKQAAMTTQGYDRDEVEKAYLRALRIDEIDRYYPGMKSPRAQPLPNPKLSIEQLKLQGIGLKLKGDQQEWANKLLEEKRLNSAKIRYLEAQAIKLSSDSDAVRSAHQLRAFEVSLSALKDHGQMLNDRISALTSAQGSGNGEDDSEGAGVPGLAAQSSNAGLSGPAAGVEGGSKGAVGEGDAEGASG